MRFKGAIIAGIALALVGCNDEPEKQTIASKDNNKVTVEQKEVTTSQLGMDNSYMSACNLLRSRTDELQKCQKNVDYRKDVANQLANSSADLVLESIQHYGETILEKGLDEEVLVHTRELPIDSMPRHLIGAPTEQVDLPKYFILKGALFGYRSSVGLSSIVIDEGYEVMLEVDKLSGKQREFLEEVCLAEMDWQAANCQGDIYVGLVAGAKTAHLSVLGAKLTPLTKERLVEIEMQKIW